MNQAVDRVVAVLKLAEEQNLVFEIIRFPLLDAVKARELSSQGHIRGKIVLVP